MLVRSSFSSFVMNVAILFHVQALDPQEQKMGKCYCPSKKRAQLQITCKCGDLIIYRNIVLRLSSKNIAM
jgi:hypothetical protein